MKMSFDFVNNYDDERLMFSVQVKQQCTPDFTLGA